MNENICNNCRNAELLKFAKNLPEMSLDDESFVDSFGLFSEYTNKLLTSMVNFNESFDYMFVNYSDIKDEKQQNWYEENIADVNEMFYCQVQGILCEIILPVYLNVKAKTLDDVGNTYIEISEYIMSCAYGCITEAFEEIDIDYIIDVFIENINRGVFEDLTSNQIDTTDEYKRYKTLLKDVYDIDTDTSNENVERIKKNILKCLSR